MALFAALIAAARVLAGEPQGRVIELYLPRLDLVLATLFFAALASALFEARDVLLLLDRVRCPRSIGYVLLSVVTIQRYVGAMAHDQMSLLVLKGMAGRGLQARLRGYYRMLAPMVAQLVARQTVHAQSLSQRGFFGSSRADAS